MARKGRAAAAADETEYSPGTESPTNEGTNMTAQADIDQPTPDVDETLPLEVPEGEFEPMNFKGKELVRAIMTNSKRELAKEGDWWHRPGKVTVAHLCDFVIRPDQPDSPELADLAGIRLKFNRWPIVRGEQSADIVRKLCLAFGEDPHRPNLENLNDVAVIIRVRTSIKEKDGVTRVNHNVNEVLRDTDFEKANGGGQ